MIELIINQANLQIFNKGVRKKESKLDNDEEIENVINVLKG